MKVIRQPPVPKPLQVECQRCKALIEVEHDDCELRFDQRGGLREWIDARLWRRR